METESVRWRQVAWQLAVYSLKAGYFRYGTSAQSFDKIQLHAMNRLSIFVADHYQRDRRFGWRVVARQSPSHLGLNDLNGIIVPPRAFKPAAPGRLNAAGEERRRAACGRTARTVRRGREETRPVGSARAAQAPRVYDYSQSEAALERPGRRVLVGMRCHDRRVEVDDQRPRRPGAACSPAFAGLGAGAAQSVQQVFLGADVRDRGSGSVRRHCPRERTPIALRLQ